MSASVEESNRRHLVQLAAVIEEYQSGQIKLPVFLSDARSLLDLISGHDQWREAFHGHWWTVEQFFAVLKDRGADPADIAKEAAVVEAFAEMSDLVEMGF